SLSPPPPPTARPPGPDCRVRFSAITLFAALLHAVWNAIAHGFADRLVGFALIGVAYTVVCGVGAVVLGPPPPAAWPFILASALVHVIYTLLLWASYHLGEFSQ